MTKPTKHTTPLPNLYEHGVFYFANDFSMETTAPVINWILQHNMQPKKSRLNYLTLMINSYGGELASAFALIDVMRGSSIPVRTVGVGIISSCGVLTFMAGEKGHRAITPNTMILSHQYSGGHGGKHHELVASAKRFDIQNEMFVDHYKKFSGMSEKKINKYLLPAEDVWLTADEAVKYGVADKVVNV